MLLSRIEIIFIRRFSVTLIIYRRMKGYVSRELRRKAKEVIVA
jgi:hypothetical protein